jgi:hypothetical protein
MEQINEQQDLMTFNSYLMNATPSLPLRILEMGLSSAIFQKNQKQMTQKQTNFWQQKIHILCALVQKQQAQKQQLQGNGLEWGYEIITDNVQ